MLEGLPPPPGALRLVLPLNNSRTPCIGWKGSQREWGERNKNKTVLVKKSSEKGLLRAGLTRGFLFTRLKGTNLSDRREVIVRTSFVNRRVIGECKRSSGGRDKP